MCSRASLVRQSSNTRHGLPATPAQGRIRHFRTGKHNTSYWVDSNQGCLVLRIALDGLTDEPALNLGIEWTDDGDVWVRFLEVQLAAACGFDEFGKGCAADPLFRLVNHQSRLVGRGRDVKEMEAGVKSAVGQGRIFQDCESVGHASPLRHW